MIHGSVLESRDLGNYGGYDVCMYSVEDVFTDLPEYDDSIWTTVYFAASRSNVVLGLFTVNDVLHNQVEDDKHAFNRVDTTLGVVEVLADAEAFSTELTQRA